MNRHTQLQPLACRVACAKLCRNQVRDVRLTQAARISAEGQQARAPCHCAGNRLALSESITASPDDGR